MWMYPEPHTVSVCEYGEIELVVYIEALYEWVCLTHSVKLLEW